ncbi:MAG: O-antigen ligase family protein [Actinomycetota bacterium]|nr:O-antigen ligase family protein [Actinomycetota bacterium]
MSGDKSPIQALPRAEGKAARGTTARGEVAGGVFAAVMPVLWALILAGYPLVSTLPTILGMDHRLVSLSFRAVVLILSLGLLAVACLERRPARAGLAAMALGGFWALYLLRLLLDTVVAPIPLRMPAGEYWLWAVGVCVFPMLTFLVSGANASLRQARQWSLLAAGAATLGALAMSALGQGTPDAEPAMRLGYATLNPISLGELGVSTIVLGLVTVRKGQRSSPRWRLVAVCCIVAGFAAVIGAASRGPLVAMLAVTGLYAVGTVRRKRLLRALVAVCLALAAVWAAARVAKNLLSTDLMGRVRLLEHPESDASAAWRLENVSRAMADFVTHPLLGSSIEDVQSQFYPHNIVVEILMATGIVGGGALIILLAGAMAVALRLLRQGGEGIWVALLFFQHLISANISGSIITSSTFWCLTAALLGWPKALGRR